MELAFVINKKNTHEHHNGKGEKKKHAKYATQLKSFPIKTAKKKVGSIRGKEGEGHKT